MRDCNLENGHHPAGLKPGLKTGLKTGLKLGLNLRRGQNAALATKTDKMEHPKSQPQEGVTRPLFETRKQRVKRDGNREAFLRSGVPNWTNHAPCDGTNAPHMRRPRGPKWYFLAAEAPPQCAADVANEPERPLLHI